MGPLLGGVFSVAGLLNETFVSVHDIRIEKEGAEGKL
jgi:hypothetical protein